MQRSVRFAGLALLCAAVMGVTTAWDHATARATPAPAAVVAAPLGTAFTYQGQLTNNGSLASGNYDFQFILYDSSVGGAQIAGTPILTPNGVAVVNGLFTVQLDFGLAFNGSQRFLEIGVRPSGTSSAYTTLVPRQVLTAVPTAQYALSAGNAANAQNAVNAQNAPWSGISGKPDALARRRIYIPAGGFGYSPGGNISPAPWGLLWKNSTQTASFVVPQPSDWDTTTPFTVTLYFALPSAPTAGTIAWQLQAGGALVNSTAANASTGWDSLDYWATQNAAPLSYPAVSSGYFDLMKTQSWVASWSSTYHTWYFGNGVSTADDFIGNPIWHFAFERGAAAGNGESYTGDMVVVGADITYQAVR